MLIYGWNDVVDLETDRVNPRKDSFLFGARPTPEQIGRLPWRIAVVQIPFVLLLTYLCVEALLVWQAARDPWIATFLIGGGLFFLMDALFLWGARPYAPWQMRLFFLGWNAAALLSIPWVWRSATLAAPHVEGVR